MSYLDDLQTLTFISPEGNSFELEYDGELSWSKEKKVAITEFALQDKSRVQDLGNTTEKYPLTCFIQGENYNVQADAFYNALFERGPAQLVHPRLGTLDVMVESVTQSENVKDEGGIATFSISFVKYDPEAEEFPETATSLIGLVENLAADLQDFSKEVLKGVTLSGATTFSAAYNRVKARVNSSITNFSNVSDNILANDVGLYGSKNEQTSFIERNLDLLLQNPDQLFQQVAILYGIPAGVLASLKEKTGAYKSAIADVTGQVTANGSVFTEAEGLIHYTITSAAVVAASLCIENGTNQSRADAIQALDDLLSIRSTYDSYIANIESKASIQSDYEIVKTTMRSITNALAYLLQQSVNLPTEKIIVLDSFKTPIQLAYEFYKDIERTDEIIEYNKLSGDEILFIPPGKEVRLL